MATTHVDGDGGPTHSLVHDWEGEGRVSDRIVAAVAEFESEPLERLPPVERSIDPEALEQLFGSTRADDTRVGCVTFSDYGYTVVVQSTGRVLLRRT